MQYSFIATCSRGIEQLLEQELRRFHADTAASGNEAGIRQTVAGVFFSGDLELAYRIVVYSRLCNRVILMLAEGPVTDSNSLYQLSRMVPWQKHLLPEQSFAIQASGSTEQLIHTQFVAQRIKDAIVDQFREQGLTRPDVSKFQPDLLVHAVIRRGKLTLGLDLTGESLHRRGYRTEQGQAPLKETLAAAVLMRCGWPKRSEEPQRKQKEAVLYDPLCGSGTLLIEGAMMALDIAPGLLRQNGLPDGQPERAARNGLSPWPHHDNAIMAELLAEAGQRMEAAAVGKTSYRFLGSDSDPGIIDIARRNAERAGLAGRVEFSVEDLATAKPDRAPTLVVTNPPYAERLGEEAEVEPLYTELGRLLRERCGAGGGTGASLKAAVFTAKPQWGKLLGIHSHKQYALFNGALPAKLLLFSIDEASVYKGRQKQDAGTHTDPAATSKAGPEVQASPDLDPGARMLANRLRKNLKTIGRWARQQGTDCFRLYDADMPEYAFAIDVYGEYVHMQEYRAPASIREEDAARRRRQARQAVAVVTGVPEADIVFKVRERQRGNEQYQAAGGASERRHGFEVNEGSARFLVNLENYLDTGLFLDHRPIRHYIHEHAKAKRFLNLYCYTGAVTVHAALGGARESVSVDLSNTYLAWAARNFELNGIDTTRHQLIQADCLTWLENFQTQLEPTAGKSVKASVEERFDLIFLDPPTFSNSKRTENVLDIQRDHAQLVRLCMNSLTSEGLLIFSTNSRRFRLDDELLDQHQVTDYTRESIDRDFVRNPGIHRTWLIRHRPARASAGF